jgi:Spy/CpxP family protein refolding chaperone
MNKVRKLFVALVLAALGLATDTPATAQGFKWWASERFQKGLALSPEQITQLDAIFQGTLPVLRAQKRALDKLEDELSRMIGEARAGEPELEAFAVRVEAARAELGKTRTLQLYRMRRVLTLEQHKKMKELHDEWERERHKGRDNRDNPTRRQQNNP